MFFDFLSRAEILYTNNAEVAWDILSENLMCLSDPGAILQGDESNFGAKTIGI